MVETIAPVVYGKKARYWSAVALHSLAAALAGAAFGGGLASIGVLANAPWGSAGIIVVAALAIAYAARELFGIPLPLFDRKQQVPDWWRTFYSPHVAAVLYGAGLGIGFLTFLRFGTYVVVSVMALVSGHVVIGALLGATFGLSRGLTTMMSAASIDEDDAAAVVVRLEKTAVTRAPRTVNGLILVLVAAVALLSSCDSGPQETLVDSNEPGTRAVSPSSSDAGPRDYSKPRVLGRIKDGRIEESSGLVASRSYEGVLWTHNDSGDGPYVYALDLHGRALGRWEVAGARAIDWEDIATGPGANEGRQALYIGDIGDNEATRDSITVYRADEPDPSSGGGTTERAQRVTLHYPDAPHDAEALLVHPTTGDLYIVTKQFSGRAVVYRADAPLETDTELVKVHRVDLPGAVGGITSGAISPLGDRLVLCTYSGALEFSLPAGAADFDSIWKQEPAAISIGGRIQGEAIAYTGNGMALLTTSEGRHSPLQMLVARRSD